MSRSPENLPRTDGLAALSVGVVLVAFAPILGDLYALPERFVRFNGFVNLCYALPGLSLTLLGRRNLRLRTNLLRLLMLANAAWTVVCVGLLLRFGGQASVFGILHIAGEGLFTATLATLEWRHRAVILGADRE